MIATLAVSPWLTGLGMVLFVGVCLLMVLTVLIQKPQGGGLAGAFGSGAGSGQTAFGTKTGDALTVFTIIVFVVYLGGSVGLNFLTQPPKAAVEVKAEGSSTGTETAPATTTAPAGTAEPAKTEPPSPDAAKPDAPKPDAPKQDAPKPEVPANSTPPAAPEPAPKR
jgi:preprotein translocase subunit SecG